MEDKIEIIFRIPEGSRTVRERTVLVNGEERFHDRRDVRTSPDDTDPIRNLELFLIGEKERNPFSRISDEALALFDASRNSNTSGFNSFIKNKCIAELHDKIITLEIVIFSLVSLMAILLIVLPYFLCR